MPRKRNPGTGGANETSTAIASITYSAKRKNIPLAGIEAHGVVRETPAVHYALVRQGTVESQIYQDFRRLATDPG